MNPMSDPDGSSNQRGKKLVGWQALQVCERDSIGLSFGKREETENERSSYHRRIDHKSSAFEKGKPPRLLNFPP